MKPRHIKLIIFIAAVGTVFQAQSQETTVIPTSLTIEQALDIAEDNNPTLKQRKLSYERTQFLLKAQLAALKSNFSLTLNPVSYNKTRQYDDYNVQWFTNETFSSGATFQVQQPILLTDGTISLTNTFGWQNTFAEKIGGSSTNKAFSNNLSLQLSQPVFTYNRTKLQIKQLEINNENASIQYALQRLTLEQNITRQFYSVYTAQERLRISQEELKNEEQNYEIVKNKVEADMFRREELYQAEYSLATSRSSVESNQVDLDNAKDQLKQTLGMPLDEPINVKAEIVASEVAIDLEHAIQHGLASRLELRTRELEEELAELTMITTQDQNKFKGNVNLSVGIMGDNERMRNIYDNPTQNPRVQVSFSVPIFDWGERRARINAQKASQTIAKLESEDQKISIELEIRQTWRDLENLRLQIANNQKNIDNAQLTYDLNLIRYREGELTGLQISQYQAQLSSAKLTYLSSLIQYKQAVLNLKIMALYDYEKDQPIVPVRELKN
ncbi:MAG: TolC family protein [Tannerella sp.]|jgi:outer membrane protein TolC|nr:TolC family protein [Tannerella sp.]